VAAQTIEQRQPSGFREPGALCGERVVIMEGIKADAKIGKIPGQADSFKVCIESPLCHVIVCQGIDDFLRDMFSLCKVNDLHLAAIDRIAEEQDLKVRRLRVFVYAALVQVDVGEGFYIYTDVFQ
jgi:hypothetical protein